MFGLKKHVNTDEIKIEEILTRGVSEIVDREHLKKRLLSGKRLRIKLGIDPTSPNLHIGRAVSLLKLKDFQDLGHIIVLIIGDVTGVIGDTSDKESERPQLNKEELKENAKTYFKQAGRVLDMSKVEKHFNSEWLLRLSYNDIGGHADQFSVADFIARENIKKRLDAGKRVSLREMLYPLMQGYDSVAIKSDVEIGGNDQWFNLLAGRKLQARFNQEPQDILTTNLILGTDGRKMSSSWGNTINLTDKPKDMYGKVMSIPDELIIPYFIHCTRVPHIEIEGIKDKMNSGENPRDFKMKLARVLVTMYHGEKDAQDAEEDFINTFQKGTVTDAVVITTAGGLFKELKETLIKEGIVKSGNEFNTLIVSGAISSITTKQVVSTHDKVENDTYKIGKKRFIKVNIV